MDTQSTDLLFNHPKRPRRFDTTSEVETARVGAHVDLHLAMEKRNPLRRGGTWGDCGSDKTRTAVGTGLGFHLGCGAAMWCWVCYPVIVHCSRTGVCIHVAPPPRSESWLPHASCTSCAKNQQCQATMDGRYRQETLVASAASGGASGAVDTE